MCKLFHSRRGRQIINKTNKTCIMLGCDQCYEENQSRGEWLGRPTEKVKEVQELAKRISGGEEF